MTCSLHKGPTSKYYYTVGIKFQHTNSEGTQTFSFSSSASYLAAYNGGYIARALKCSEVLSCTL